MTLEKTCTGCGIVKPLDQFYVKDPLTGRLYSRCKACHNVYQSEKSRQATLLRQAKRADEQAALPPTESKHCPRCGEDKPLWAFSKQKGKPGGLRVHCKACCIVAADAYRATHGTTINQSALIYRDAHKAEIAERQRQWRRDHLEESKEIARQSKEKHAEARFAYRSAYQKAHRDQYNTHSHNRRAKVKSNGGTHTTQEWLDLKAKYDHTCLMCGRKEPEIVLSRDHIVPIVKGGTNGIDNIQPICRRCNSRKSRQIIDLRQRPI